MNVIDCTRALPLSQVSQIGVAVVVAVATGGVGKLAGVEFREMTGVRATVVLVIGVLIFLAGAERAEMKTASLYKASCGTTVFLPPTRGKVSYCTWADGQFFVDTDFSGLETSASYGAYLLSSTACDVQFDPKVSSITDSSGSGRVQFDGKLNANGKGLALQLVSPSSFVVPGAGVPDDVLMTRFELDIGHSPAK